MTGAAADEFPALATTTARRSLGSRRFAGDQPPAGVDMRGEAAFERAADDPLVATTRPTMSTPHANEPIARMTSGALTCT
jgi:hypothetical protein